MNTLAYRLIALGALLALGTGGTAAADPTPTNPAPASVAGEALRDPFLPLDSETKAEAPVAPPAEPKPDSVANTIPTVDPRTLIRVQGIVCKGDRVYALVNGRMASKGDTIRIQAGGATYRFLVRDITNKKVAIDPIP